VKKANRQSSGKLLLYAILSVLGMIGLMQSSFRIISSLVFISSSNKFILLRAVIVLAVSVLFLVAVAKFGGDANWLKTNLWKIPFGVVALGCLGLVWTIFNLYELRQPHSLTEYETRWLVIGIAMVAICFWWLHQSRKHTAKTVGQVTLSNAEIASGKTLRPAPRPYIALGIIFGVVALIVIVPMLEAEKPLEAMKQLQVAFLCYTELFV
jgi:hypothetical protein